MVSDGALTRWISRLRAGEPEAFDHLLPLVYEELRGLARSQLRGENPGHTLGATALVHEAYVRLAARDVLQPHDRAHFFAIAAQAMRRVLIDHARSRGAQKRGSGQVPLSFEDAAALIADGGSEELLHLDRALERLAEANPRAAQVVEHRFFAGLTLDESAVALGRSKKTVQRDWIFARAWLQREIMGSTPPGPAEGREPPEYPSVDSSAPQT